MIIGVRTVTTENTTIIFNVTWNNGVIEYVPLHNS